MDKGGGRMTRDRGRSGQDDPRGSGCGTWSFIGKPISSADLQSKRLEESRAFTVGIADTVHKNVLNKRL